MGTVKTFFLFLLMALAAAAPARADDILIDGQDGCARLHGYWSGSTCAVQHLVVGLEDRVIVDGTVAFVVIGRRDHRDRWANRAAAGCRLSRMGCGDDRAAGQLTWRRPISPARLE